MAAFESKKYAWRSGYSYRVPAATVGGVLEKIEREQGKVDAETFLDYSRDEKTETHGMFEWNDSIAAERFRLGQARKIINQLEVCVVYEEAVPVEMQVELNEAQRSRPTVSAYVNVNKRAPGARAIYMNVESAMSDSETRKQVLENAMQELKAFKQKYRQLKELSDVFRAIEKLERDNVC